MREAESGCGSKVRGRWWINEPVDGRKESGRREWRSGSKSRYGGTRKKGVNGSRKE